MNRFTRMAAVALVATTCVVAVAKEPTVKVFILAGQSNMEGHGKVEYGRNPDFDPNTKGSPQEIKGGMGGLRYLATHPDTAAKYRHLLDADGNWIVRDDVWVYTTTPGREKGPLTVGYGKGAWFGPEFAFGHILGDRMEEPVLLIKTAWGGHDLGVKFRPPSSGLPEYASTKFTPEEVGSSYRKMMSIVKDVTGNLGTHFPELQGHRVEFAGFGWHQGWNDACSDEMTAEYGKNLANLIRDVRKDLGVENLPFVIANTGQNGLPSKGRFAEVCAVQLEMGDPQKHPEFKGTVASVDTRGFKRTTEESPSGFGYHWNHNAESHYLVGEAMGTAMAGLLGLTAPEPEHPEFPWKNPEYRKDIPATTATSRAEEPGWNLWIPHHENRKRWVTEQDVDLLMMGDSIVFMWSRTGRKVWEEFYGNRKAVNIGSSGDRTEHMLWHIQNGGLDGMKDKNPKLVVMMISTNNRGDPEKHGEDTAYGVLALLKEIHARLPHSKVLLLAVFPRGKTPEDKGRVRNEEVNAILQTYADNETVFWMDIGGVFLENNGNLKLDLMPDALHPNEAGYKVWAEAMEPFIRQHLGE